MSLVYSNFYYGSYMSLQTMKAQMKLLFVHTMVINYVGLGWTLELYQ